MPATPAQIELMAGLERRRVAASLERRIDDLADLLHDDFVFVHSSGRVDSRADYLSVLSSGALTYETMQSSDLAVKSASDSLATVLSRLDLVALFQGRRVAVSALALTVWVKGAMGWQALSIQSTPVPPAAG
jgi:hypothetical protein